MRNFQPPLSPRLTPAPPPPARPDGSTRTARQPETHLNWDLIGRLFGDKGYVGEELARRLFRRGLALITPARRKMKRLPVSLDGAAAAACKARFAWMLSSIVRCG
ncbi:transposase [Rhodopila sp.]|uniref:transposase n=1 Tax=Rhodopila sp. TaxID=2480087 RepID=UPI003D0F3BDA